MRCIVYPLDGTVNYLYGLGEWAVCVAAEVDGVVVAGVVHAPALGVTWTAEADGAAVRKDGQGRRQVVVGSESRLGHCLIGTGFGYDADRRRKQAQALVAILPKVRDIRRAGAAAIDLCRVADGTLDGYFEQGLKPWDHAAAALVVRRAGGVAGGWPGEPLGEGLAVAANESVFNPLQDLVAGAINAGG